MDRILKLQSVNFANKSIKAEEKKLTTYQPLHWHDYYEIEYIIDGAGEYIINGNVNEIKKGILFFSTPTDVHEIKFTKETHIINISFTSHYIDDKLISDTLSSYVATDTNEFFRTLLDSIVNLSSRVTKKRTLYIRGILTSILVLILNNSTPLETNRSHIASHKNLRNIIFYINQHFSEDLSLDELAKVANLTPKYLSKRFIEMAGIPLSQYISDVRLNYAKNLIVTTDIPIQQICHTSGFNSMPYFSRSFKAKFNLSPSKMRNISSNAKI